LLVLEIIGDGKAQAIARGFELETDKIEGND